jgi:flavorubredoxin
MVVNDGEEHSLGKHNLRFYLTPMVHWPETMMTYDEKTGVLFSGDAFGSFGTLNGGIFDDEVNLSFFENEILRYFSNIIGKYCDMVQKALGKLKGLDIKIIASTHGPVFRKDPSYIVKLYDRWSRQETERGVVIVYASMYGNTQIMAESIARSIASEGVENIRLHNISRTHLSFILTDIWRFRGLVLGSCTYNTRLFPPMEMLLSTLENDRLKGRVLGIFGSYSWSGGAVKALMEYAKGGLNRHIEPVIETRFSPTEEDLKRCIELGKNIAKVL